MTSLNPSHRNLIEFVLSVNDAQAKNALNKFGMDVRRNLRDFQTFGAGTFDQAFKTPRNFAEFRSNLSRLREDLRTSAHTGWIGMNQLSDGFRTGRIELQRLQGGVRAAVNVANFSRQFDALTSRWMSMAKNFQWTGRQLVVGLTLPLAMFGKAAIDTFLKIEQEYTRLQKVVTTDIWNEQTRNVDAWSGSIKNGIKLLDQVKDKGKVISKEKTFMPQADATVGENMKKMGDELAITFGASHKQVASLMADWAAMGYQAENLGQIVSTVLKTGILGDFGGNLEGASNLVRSTMAIWTQDLEKVSGKTATVAEKFNEVNNLMAKASAIESSTSIWMGELAGSLPEVSNSAQLFGLKFEELLGIMAAMKQRGIESSEAANGLKFVMQRITNPTQKAVDAFKEFTGLDLEKLIAGKTGIEKLTTVIDAVKGLSKEDQQKVLGDIGGLRQADRFISALNGIKAGQAELANKTLKTSEYTEDYARAMAAAAQSQDELNAAAGRKVDVNLKSYPQQIKILQAQMEALKSSLGEEIVPYFIAGFQALINLFKKFESMSEGAKKFILGVAAAAASLGPVILVMGQLGLALASIAHLANKIPLFAGNALVKLFAGQNDQLLMVAGAIETSQSQAAAMSATLLANAERLTVYETSRLSLLQQQNTALAEQAAAAHAAALTRENVSRDALVGVLPELQQSMGRRVTRTDIIAEARNRPELSNLTAEPPELVAARAERRVAAQAYKTAVHEEYMRRIASLPHLEDPIAHRFDMSHVVGGRSGLYSRYEAAETAAGRTPRTMSGKGSRGISSALKKYLQDNLEDEVKLAREEVRKEATKATFTASGSGTPISRLRGAGRVVRRLETAHEDMIEGAIRNPDDYLSGATSRRRIAERLFLLRARRAAEDLRPQIEGESIGTGIRDMPRRDRRSLIFGEDSLANRAARAVGRGVRNVARLPTEGIDKATASLAGGTGIWTRFTTVVNNARQGLGRFLTGLPGIGPMLARVGTAFQELGTSITTAFVANPIGIIIAAIVALLAFLPAIAALTGHWDDFKEGFMNGISGIKEIFLDAWDSIKSAGMALFDALKVIWQSVVGIVQSIIGVFVDVGDKGDGSGKKTKSGWAQIGNVFGMIAKTLAVVIKMFAVILTIVAKVIAFVVKLVAGVVNFIVTLAKAFGFLDIIGNIIAFVIELVRGNWVNAFKYLGNAIIQFMLWPFVGAINLMIKAYNALPFKNIKEVKIGNIFNAKKIDFSFDGKKAGEKGAKDADKPLKNLPTKDTQKDITDNVAGAIADGASSGADQANQIMMDMINALKSRLDEQISRVKDEALKAFDKIQKKKAEQFEKDQKDARTRLEKRQSDFIKKNYDDRIKAIEDLNKADEKRYATEEYLANRRENLEQRQQDHANYIRSRRAAMFAGNIDKVRQLDMEEIKSKKDSEKALANMDEQRRRELVQQTRQAAIDRINTEKEAQQKIFENDMKAFDERQKRRREQFDEEQAQQRQHFEDQLTDLTEHTATTIGEYQAMLDGINALLVTFGGSPVFKNTATMAMNAFTTAIHDAEGDMTSAADWSGKTYALQWLESFWTKMRGFKNDFVFFLQGLPGGTSGGGGGDGGGGQPNPPAPKPKPKPKALPKPGDPDFIGPVNNAPFQWRAPTGGRHPGATQYSGYTGTAIGPIPTDSSAAFGHNQAVGVVQRDGTVLMPDGTIRKVRPKPGSPGFVGPPVPKSSSKKKDPFDEMGEPAKAGFALPEFKASNMNKYGEWLGKAGGWIKKNVPKFFKGAWDWFRGLGGWLFDGVKRGLNLGGKLIGWLGEQISKIAGQLGGMFSAVGEWFAGLPKWFIDRAKSGVSLVTRLVNWLKNTVTNLASRIGGIFKSVFTWFSSLPGKFMENIRKGVGFGARLVNWLTNSVGNFADRLGGIFSRVFDWFGGLPRRIVDRMGDIAGVFAEVGGDIISGIGRGLQNAVSFIGDVGSAVWKGFLNIFDTQVLQRIRNFSIFGKKPFEGAIDGLRSKLGLEALAEGGFINKPTNALIGEAGPELVLPLTRPARMNQLLIDAQKRGLINPMKFMAPLSGGGFSAGGQGGVGGMSTIIQETNIYVDNFIGEKQWFEKMMKEYNVHVRPSDQVAKGRVTRNISSYKDNLSRYY